MKIAQETNCAIKTIDKINLIDVIKAVQSDISILTVMKNMPRKILKKMKYFLYLIRYKNLKKILKKTFDMILSNKVNLKNILEDII